ncbi:MAG: amino acid ABC transporter substrate-binding protein [Ruminococcaceae bacterium]|nr:amino acid ABC transporter substrate-binding protein [Oscillospiraceae bacterium]
MKRRTFISLMSVMAAAGVLSLSGCGSSGSSSAAASSTTSSGASGAAAAGSDLLSTIQSRGTLIVALEGAWQPWSYHDESDTLVGYDVEVSRAIAEKLGVEPEYVESDWDSLFAGMDAGRYDLVCNGVEVTDERSKTYDFTTPYGYIHTALAVKKDNDEIKTFEDLKGKTTANSLASTYMELAESYGATVQGIDTLEETIQLLTAGRIDATLNADVSFYDYLNVHPDADFKIVALTEEASHVAIPLRKGEETASLREAIDKAIEELRAEGTLTELSEKYFGQDISSEN